MLQSILEFLDGNKALIGAVVTITEILTIIINFIRKIKNDKAQVHAMREVSVCRKLLWSANPVNLFRKP